MADELILRLGLALAIGLVVGVERGWQRRNDPEGSRTAGVRTFTLVGLFGGVAGVLAERFGSPLLFAALLLALVAPFAAFSYRESREEADFSVTSVVAAVLVFALGALAAVGDMRAAAAGGAVTAGVLASRAGLHGLVARLTWIELRSALLLIAMTAVVLPILPDRPVDPWGALNLRELWLLMVLMAGVSYLGYVAMKLAGPANGPPVAGLAGGLASSTATTIALARRSRGLSPGPAVASGLASGVALAAMVSVVRTGVLAMAIAPALSERLVPALSAGATTFGLAGLALMLRPRTDKPEMGPIGAPFDIGPVLAFGALLAAVSLLGALAVRFWGAAGVYGLALLSGMVDVDAVTLANARSAAHGLAADVAGWAILIALASNAALRAVYCWLFGTRALAMRVSLITALALAAGGAGALLASAA